MSNYVEYMEAQCLGVKKCGACIGTCPYGALKRTGNKISVKTSFCENECSKTYGNISLRPCQKKCRSQLIGAGHTGSLALVTAVSS